MRLALLAVVATLAAPAFRLHVQPGPSGGVDVAKIAAAAAAKTLAELPHRGRVPIDLSSHPTGPMAATGVGGFADTVTGDVTVFWDPQHADLRRTLLTWLSKTVAHELVHSSRIRVGAGYGPTLGDQLVNEGLADHFADQLYPHAPRSPWDHLFTKAQERAYWRAVRPQLKSQSTGIFMGGGTFPLAAGYTLGYDIVGQYLAAHPLTPAGYVHVKASAILADFHGP